MVGHATLYQPLILTLRIDDVSQRFFNELRRRHFPRQINYLDAHLTLFHALPEEEEILTEIAAIAEHEQVFSAVAESIRSIGNGTVIKINSPKLLELHGMFQKKWASILSKQDRQKLWPHITIQNKVTPTEAKALHQQLASTFEEFTFNALGLQLWRYQGGPWEYVTQFKFNGQKIGAIK